MNPTFTQPRVVIRPTLPTDTPALLLDSRRYSHQNGFDKIVWNARLTTPLDDILASAGFAREGDDSNYEYERQHPDRP